MSILLKTTLGAGTIIVLLLVGAIGYAWFSFREIESPLNENIARLEVDIKLARDSVQHFQMNYEKALDENRWYKLMIPSESGIYHPADIAHQYYLYGQQKGRYLELHFSANKYFAHRRRGQGYGVQRILEASTPHESFLYDILDSLGIDRNNSKKNDENAQRILNFVNSIPYHEKSEYYVKMPIETLVEGRGNCADLSVLMHSMMITAGLDAILVFPTAGDTLDHAMVGVHGDFNFDRTRTYFTYPDSAGRRYYLCQPTGTDDKRYPILHKVGFSKRYPYSIIYKDSISVVENKKEWLKRPFPRR